MPSGFRQSRLRMTAVVRAAKRSLSGPRMLARVSGARFSAVLGFLLRMLAPALCSVACTSASKKRHPRTGIESQSLGAV
jgi:hypothetical protein